MTASEARRLTEQAVALEGLKWLFKEIEQAAREQKTSVMVSKGRLTPAQHRLLISPEYKYKVESEPKDFPTDFETPNYIISW